MEFGLFGIMCRSLENIAKKGSDVVIDQIYFTTYFQDL